jgi:hypothetical protein
MILSICEALLLISLTSAMGVMCGLFSYLLDYCFWKGNIFEWYLPWLADRVVRDRDMAAWKSIREMGSYSGSWKDEMMASADRFGVYKVLGGCAVCLNVWIAVNSWVAICLLTPVPWYYGFAYVLMASAVIRKLVGAVY